jgi:hypothetical protein
MVVYKYYAKCYIISKDNYAFYTFFMRLYVNFLHITLKTRFFGTIFANKGILKF